VQESTNGTGGNGSVRAAGGQRIARIVVARSESALESPGVARALEGLGRGATVELVSDAPACIERCAGGDVDLVVVDAALGRGCEEILRALRSTGPPVLVAQEIPDDREALAWFRRGAADCVVARSERLGAAASEQIARARVRARGAADPERPDVTQHLNSALLVVDREGRIASCNPPAEQILAPGGEDLHGRRVSEYFRTGPDGESLLARSLEKGERFKGAETLATRADGSAVPVGISCAPIVDTSGRISGAVVLFQDLSEVTRMRSHVLQREKMASIGQLAAGVAHEINNPMGFIHANLFQMAEYATELRQVWGRVEALQKVVGGEDPHAVAQAASDLANASDEADVPFLLTDLAKAIRESQEGSERIRHIVQDLRDFSHVDTDERILTDINQCLDSTANIVWPMMKHVVVLEKEYADLPEVPCYPMQIKQVFMNLLVNACQAIEDSVGGGGEVGTIALETRALEDGVVVVVRDSGSGIAPEHQARIFDPFFTTKKVGAGTGLGLSTSFNIVQRHGGALTVESRPGEGAAFRVFLPLLRERIGGGN
jgi:PAS domain S-box-containing protein